MHDEMLERGEPVIRVLLDVAHADTLRESTICLFVISNDERNRCIDSVRRQESIHHSGFWLTTLAVVFGGMRAEENLVEDDVGILQSLQQQYLCIDEVCARSLGKILIGHHDEVVAVFLEIPECL